MNEVPDIIKELELSLLKPEVRASKEALNRLLADDFIEFGTSGKKYTKADILERLPNSTESIEYVVSDFDVHMPSENIAVATFKTVRTKSGTDAVTSLRSSHWRKKNGFWQMFFHSAAQV